MLYFISKTMISALVIAVVSELARRYTIWAALIASLPLTSILAFIWVYWESKDKLKVAELSFDVFWLVMPSLPLFLALSYLLKSGMSFGLSLTLSISMTVLLYTLGVWVYKSFIV